MIEYLSSTSKPTCFYVVHVCTQIPYNGTAMLLVAS